MDLPMLDEDEFARIQRRWSQAFHKRFTEHRQEHGLAPDAQININDLFEPVRQEYEQITGMSEPNHKAIMHHRISIYGPPCHACGKPLRTPQAKLCAVCWARVPGR
jgi:hypothetical protein